MCISLSLIKMNPSELLQTPPTCDIKNTQTADCFLYCIFVMPLCHGWLLLRTLCVCSKTLHFADLLVFISI